MTLKEFSKGMCDPNACALPNGTIDWRKTINIRTTTINERSTKRIYSFWREARYVDVFTDRFVIQQEWLGVHAGEVVDREWREVYNY